MKAAVLRVDEGAATLRPLPIRPPLITGESVRSLVERAADANVLTAQHVLGLLTGAPDITLAGPYAIAPAVTERLAALLRATPEVVTAALDQQAVVTTGQDQARPASVVLGPVWTPGLRECPTCRAVHHGARRGPFYWARTILCLRHRRVCVRSEQTLAGRFAPLWPLFHQAQRQLDQHAAAVPEPLAGEAYRIAMSTVVRWLGSHSPEVIHARFDIRYARYRDLSQDRAILMLPETAALTAVFGTLLTGPAATTLDLMGTLTVSGAAALQTSPISPFYWRAAALELVNTHALHTPAGPRREAVHSGTIPPRKPI